MLGGDEIALKLYELALGACVGMLVLPPERPVAWHQCVPAREVRALGFGENAVKLASGGWGFIAAHLASLK